MKMKKKFNDILNENIKKNINEGIVDYGRYEYNHNTNQLGKMGFDVSQRKEGVYKTLVDKSSEAEAARQKMEEEKNRSKEERQQAQHDKYIEESEKLLKRYTARVRPHLLNLKAAEDEYENANDELASLKKPTPEEIPEGASKQDKLTIETKNRNALAKYNLQVKHLDEKIKRIKNEINTLDRYIKSGDDYELELRKLNNSLDPDVRAELSEEDKYIKSLKDRILGDDDDDEDDDDLLSEFFNTMNLTNEESNLIFGENYFEFVNYINEASYKITAGNVNSAIDNKNKAFRAVLQARKANNPVLNFQADKNFGRAESIAKATEAEYNKEQIDQKLNGGGGDPLIREIIQVSPNLNLLENSIHLLECLLA